MAGEMRVSQGARPLLAMMRQMFPELVVRMVLEQAAVHVRLRGGREITCADWDAASEELAAMASERSDGDGR